MLRASQHISPKTFHGHQQKIDQKNQVQVADVVFVGVVVVAVVVVGVVVVVGGDDVVVAAI